MAVLSRPRGERSEVEATRLAALAPDRWDSGPYLPLHRVI